MTKLYIASRFKNKELIRGVIRALPANRYEVVSTWPKVNIFYDYVAEEVDYGFYRTQQNPKSQMKLLITGCAGFLGRYAVSAALARGWEVDGFDIHHPSAVRQMDVRLLSRVECDVILHLAAYSSNAGFADWLAENYANNVMGLWNVLSIAGRCGVKRVVYASSSAVYGSNCGRWECCEDDTIDDLGTHYGRSKLMNEAMAASFCELGLPCLGLRIFNAYGEGDERKAPGRQAPPTWMQAAKREGKPAVIFDDGKQAKDFIHARDVAEIMMRLIESDATGIVNVGTGVATSFKALADMIGVEREYKPVPDPKSYQYFTLADTRKLLSIIGPYEFVSLEEGVKL